jgi:hypothetical protein
MMVLDRFPKTRPELPEAYRKIYNSHYLRNREGRYATTSLSQKLESWMHRKVAADHEGLSPDSATLEIGAGTLNQLQYEPAGRPYDIVEPFRELFDGSPWLDRVRDVYSDLAEVPAARRYDRITSIATFEHIVDLPLVVARAIGHLNQAGRLRVAIPNEGTLMWRLGTMVTGFDFKRRYGMDYRTLMQYEHVNTAREIEDVLKHFFESCRCSVFGLNRTLAFYRFYDCSGPRLREVAQYLARRSNA